MTFQQGSPVVDADPPKKQSRAGRDLPAAIAVGAVLGAMAIGSRRQVTISALET